MFRKVPLVILVACLLAGLGAGIGAGYAIKANEAEAEDPAIQEYELQVAALKSEISDLESEIASLNAEIEQKRAEYDSLQTTHEATMEELEALRRNYALLDRQRQVLKQDYDALFEACDNPTVEKLLELSEQLVTCQNELALSQIRVTQLEKQVTPSPDRALDREVLSQVPPRFSSPQWEGRDYELQLKLQELVDLYHSMHTYVPGAYGPNEFDCNDMAVDMWNMLLTQGITSVIVIGNKNKVDETFEEADHAWLYAFNADGKVIYLDPTTGDVMYGRLPDGSTNPEAAPYREGFIYAKPSDLRLDLKHWW